MQARGSRAASATPLLFQQEARTQQRTGIVRHALQPGLVGQPALALFRGFRGLAALSGRLLRFPVLALAVLLGLLFAQCLLRARALRGIGPCLRLRIARRWRCVRGLRLTGLRRGPVLVFPLLCLLLGYPMAYAIARASKEAQTVLLLLIMMPTWTAILIRVYAWIGILKNNGLLNNLLMKIGIIDEPLQILYTPMAAYIGIVYCYLPFMVLPLYTNLVKHDHRLLEAAYDLGAKPWKAFFTITLPLSKAGIIAGCMVIDGVIRRNANARLLREGVVIHDSSIGSLRREKDDVTEAREGYECGLSFEKYNDIKVGDIVEAYVMEQIEQ